MRILIYGNSGSGKSTLAKFIAKQYNLSHLDLDPLAWSQANDGAPVRTDLADVIVTLNKFNEQHTSWVIEGCYADIINLISAKATTMIFLDLSIDDCIHNAKERPWEPHKYKTKALQDDNQAMLINWIMDYPTRTDDLSHIAHLNLYQHFHGTKYRLMERPLLEPSGLSFLTNDSNNNCDF